MANRQKATVLITHPPGLGDYWRQFRQKIAEAYVAVHGFEPNYVVDESGQRFLQGGEPHYALRSLPPGTPAIVPSWDMLAKTPAELREGLPKIIGAGVRLYVMEAGYSEIASQLPTLMTAWRHAEPVERALAEEQTAHKQSLEFWSGEFARFEADLTAGFVRAYGLPPKALDPSEFYSSEVVAALAAHAEAQAPKANGHAKHDWTALGTLVKERREAKAMRQDELAAMLGKSASAVSRLEATGEGPNLIAALEIVAPDMLPPEDVRAALNEDGLRLVLLTKVQAAVPAHFALAA